MSDEAERAQAGLPPVPSEAAAPEKARSWLRLIIDPLFGRYFLGRTLSSAGVWIHNVVAALLAYELTGSALIVGLVSVAQFLPQLLFALASGVAADKGNRKRQVIIGRLIVGSGSGGMAVWLAFGGAGTVADTIALLVSAAIVGAGFVTGGPAMHAMIPALVRPSEVASAVTLNTAPVTLARAVGPLIGTAIAFSVGNTIAFAIAALCNAAFAVLIFGLRVPGPKQKARDTSMRAGFAFLRRDRVSAYLLVGVAVVGMAADPAITLAPPLSVRLVGGTELVGAFASAFGAGAGIAFLLIPLLRRYIGLVRYGTLGLGAMAVGLSGQILMYHPLGAVLAFGVAGVGMTLALTSLSSQLQERLPDQLRGRIMALWSMGFLGSRPVAAALDGALADFASLDVAFGVMGALALGAALLCRPRHLSAPALLASEVAR